MNDISDAELIRQYLKGDEKSLEFLIKKYLKPIYNFIYKNVGYQEVAEDITQETFIKVWKNLKKFDQKRDFKPWIFQIAKNTLIDYSRKKKTIPFPKLENLKEDSQNLVDFFANKIASEKILNNLDKEEQKIISMRHSQGMSFKQIAKFFGKPVNTVKSRYRRIMINIKKEYKPKNKDKSYY